MFSILVSLLPVREQLDTDIEEGISIEDRARVLRKHRALMTPNGRDLAAMLNVEDKSLIESWNLGKHQESTFMRLRNANNKNLRDIVRTLLHYRGLQYGAGGNWAPVLEMHCFEVRSCSLIFRI
jgi:hypothetical protein